MGLFDFVKEAGTKIFGAQPKKPPVGVEAGGQPAPTGPRSHPEKAAELEEFVRGLGLEVAGLKIEVVGFTATVHGKVPSQALKEKVVLAVGNVEGVGRVDDRLEVEVPEPPAVFYVVKKGDTLSKIAKEHYGKASQYPVIFEANRPMLSDPDKIFPGQVLRIPAAK